MFDTALEDDTSSDLLMGIWGKIFYWIAVGGACVITSC